MPSTLRGSQPSTNLDGQVLHHLVQEEHLGPTVAELEEPRQMQLAPETQGGLAVCLQQTGVFLTPVLELRPVSPASAPAQPEDVPAVASAPVPGPELEPPGPSGPGPVTPAGMAVHLAEPKPDTDPTRPHVMSIWDIAGVVSAPVPGPELEPPGPSGPGPVTPAGMAPGLAEPEVGPEPTSPCAMSTQDVPREEEPTILAFPRCLVAEQLTLMYAVLFTRMTYSECKACFLNQPHMGGIEHLAPTIHKVIQQFDSMVNLVTSSCLRAPSMTAWDRAQVVDFWIQVAKECLALKNFTSLHAILLALQSPAVHCLESTWGHVSWKSSWMYENLKRRDKCINRKRLLKEADSVVKQQLWGPLGTEDRKKQWHRAWFLGMFLDDLPVDQLPEHKEDVASVLHDIIVHTLLALDYNLEPEEHFMSFFQAVETLDEEESYTLSCQLEFPGWRAGRKGLLCFRFHNV